MGYDLEQHHRRSIRLPGYDYTQIGAYFMTICTQNKRCLFGEVVDGKMQLNNLGQIVDACWRAIPDHFPNILCDAWVIMPNHMHGILVIDIDNVGARHAVPLREPQPEQFGNPTTGSVPTLVRSFKSTVTKRINEMRGTPGATLWQRNYYEHVIRNGTEWDFIRKYIETNPALWAEDNENPSDRTKSSYDSLPSDWHHMRNAYTRES